VRVTSRRSQASSRPQTRSKAAVQQAWRLSRSHYK